MVMIGPDDQARIEAAVRAAEARTAGEIVVVIAPRAGSYRSVPLLYALIAALLAPWPLIWLSGLSAARIFLVQLAVAVVTLCLAAWGADRLLLVPEAIKRARGREAAAREFARGRLTATRARTAVLIYVAVAERYAEVVADAGVAARVGEAAWREVIVALVERLRAGEPALGLLAAVERVGAILAEHVPASPGDRDELPNRLILG
jgi:putative membrane protein